MLTDQGSNYPITLEISPDKMRIRNCVMEELKVFTNFDMSLYSSQSVGTEDKMRYGSNKQGG